MIDRATLDFLLYDWLRLDALAARPVFDHDRATIDAVLDLAEELAQKELLPHFSLSYRQEPLLDMQSEVRIPDQVAAALANICKTGITSVHRWRLSITRRQAHVARAKGLFGRGIGVSALCGEAH